MIRRKHFHWKSKVRLDQILVVLYAIYSCRGIWLAFDSNRYMPWYSILLRANTYLCVCVAIIYFLRKRVVSASAFLACLVPTIYWLLQVCHPAGTYNGGWELAYITIVLFLLLPDGIKSATFKVFYWIVQSTNVIAIMIWIIYFAGINIGFQRVLYYSQANEYITYYYYKWFIFAIYSDGASYRLCSIFNEPGGLGTLCALLFICTYKKASYWEKAILLVAGTLTFSLAFFLLIFAFIAVHVCQKRLFNLVYIFLFVFVFLAIPNIDFHNDLLNQFAARFEITDNGLVGDNRTSDSFDAYYESFVKSNDVWLGNGPGYSFAHGGLSYKTHYIVPYGIIGTTILLGSWLILAIHYSKKSKEALWFSFFFFVSLYQRPSIIMGISGYVLLIGGINWLKQVGQKREKILC